MLSELAKFGQLLRNTVTTDKTEVVLTTHPNADIDAVASILGIYHILRKLGAFRITIDIERIKKDARKLLEYYNLENIEALQNKEDGINTFNKILIMTDNTNFDRLPNGFTVNSEFYGIFIIDHHTDSSYGWTGEVLSEKIIEYKDDSASSASELVTRLWMFYDGKDLFRNKSHFSDNIIARILFAGIMDDSKFLRFGTTDVIKSLDFLRKKGADLSETRLVLSNYMELSEKIARLKGAMRIKGIYKIKSGNKIWPVVITETGSYEASVASGLIELGADIAFTVSKKRGGYRISARASDEIQNTIGIDLAALLTDFSKHYGGSAGGHNGAAGLKIPELPSDFESKLIGMLKKYLK